MLKSKLATGILAAVLAVTLTAGSGCYGPFKATKALHKWNDNVSENKWAKEGVFLLFTFIPVYQVTAGLVDALVCNSIEFWTGSNPFDEAGDGADGGAEITPHN